MGRGTAAARDVDIPWIAVPPRDVDIRGTAAARDVDIPRGGSRRRRDVDVTKRAQATASVVRVLECVGRSRRTRAGWLATQTPDLLRAAKRTLRTPVDADANTLRTGLGLALTEDAFYDFLAAAHEVLRFDQAAFDAMAAEAVQAKFGDQASFAPAAGAPTTRALAPYQGVVPAFPPRRDAPAPNRPHVDAAAASRRATEARGNARPGVGRYGVADDWKDRIARARGSYAPRIAGQTAEPAGGAVRRAAPKGVDAVRRSVAAARQPFADHPLTRTPNPGGGPCLAGLDLESDA